MDSMNSMSGCKYQPSCTPVCDVETVCHIVVVLIRQTMQAMQAMQTMQAKQHATHAPHAPHATMSSTQLAVKWKLARQMLKELRASSDYDIICDLLVFMQDQHLFIDLVSLANQLLRNRVYDAPGGMAVVTTVVQLLHDQQPRTYSVCWALLLQALLCHHKVTSQLASQLTSVSQWYIDLYNVHYDHREEIVASARAGYATVKTAKTRSVFAGLVRCLETRQESAQDLADVL